MLAFLKRGKTMDFGVRHIGVFISALTRAVSRTWRSALRPLWAWPGVLIGNDCFKVTQLGQFFFLYNLCSFEGPFSNVNSEQFLYEYLEVHDIINSKSCCLLWQLFPGVLCLSFTPNCFICLDYWVILIHLIETMIKKQEKSNCKERNVEYWTYGKSGMRGFS